MDTISPARDIRARRAAQRQGLTLSKTRTRDPRALTYGKWTLTNDTTGEPVPGAHLVPFDVVEKKLGCEEPLNTSNQRRALTDA